MNPFEIRGLGHEKAVTTCRLERAYDGGVAWMFEL